jgi:phosphopentomutase
VLGNIAASGTQIIQELGDAAVQKGALIVYTSADSVLQIAAHEQVVPVAELYRICSAVHDYVLSSPHKVARVIARPFTGEFGHYVRTERRHDYSARPGHTLLNLVEDSGGQVLAVGKIVDIFAGQGVTEAYRTKGNQEGIATTLRLVLQNRGSLIFTNLVDFDMLYGHRNDPSGYGRALEEFDQALPELLDALAGEDLLIITADHGCDPVTESTDHSREYVPCLVYHRGITGRVLPDQPNLCTVGSTVGRWLGLGELPGGNSLLGGETDACS